MLSRLDSSFVGENAIFLQHQLRAVQNKAFQQTFPALKARQFIPVNRVDAGAEAISTTVWENFGSAKIISADANDLPSVYVGQKEAISKIVTLGCHFQYSIIDLKRAAKAKVPLNAKLATTARAVIESKVDALACEGDEKSGIKGLANNDNIEEIKLTSWFKGDTGKTSKEILEDVFKLVNNVIEKTNDSFLADTLLLPVKHYAYLSQTPYGNSSTVTLLSYILSNNPYIKNIDSWTRLKDRMIFYPRTSQALEMFIPQEFEILQPESRGLNLVFNCISRFGGVQVYAPKACCYGTNI